MPNYIAEGVRSPTRRGSCGGQERHALGRMSVRSLSTPNGIVPICPKRLYGQRDRVFLDIAATAFPGPKVSLVRPKLGTELTAGKTRVVLLGHDSGREARLPGRKSADGGKKTAGFFVDWIMARLDSAGPVAGRTPFRCWRSPR